MKIVFDLIVSFFSKIVLADFFKHLVMMMVFVWLFSMVYTLGKRQ